MNRLMMLCVLSCALVCVPANADDLPKKPTTEERKELEAKWRLLNADGAKASREKKIDEALKLCQSALEIARRLYPKDEFPVDTHPWQQASGVGVTEAGGFLVAVKGG